MKDRFSHELDQFERQGYAIFRDVLDDALVDETRSHVDWLLEKNPELRPEQLHHSLMTDDPFWVRLISDDRLLDIAEAFIGPNIALFASHYIAKPPLDGKAVLWHQDGSYWPLEPMDVVTLWLAVDRSDTENGCLRVLPGTQTGPLFDEHELEVVDDGTNVLGTGIRPENLATEAAVDIVLNPGDLSVHHANVIHGSDGNRSERWRRGLTIRYIPATTRILTDEVWPCAFMLRGQPQAGVNKYRERPRYRRDVHMPFRGADQWNKELAQ